MRILQLVPRLPYPPDDGGKIGILGFTEAFLELGHRVRLAGFDEDSASREFAESVGLRLDRWDAPKIRKWRKLSALGGAVSGLGVYPRDKYFDPCLLRSLLESYDEWKPHLIHVDHTHMAEYGLRIKRARADATVVLRAHNIESVIWKRSAALKGSELRRSLMLRAARQVERYESRIFQSVDAVLAISEADRHAIAVQAPGARVGMMPAGCALQRAAQLRADLCGAPRLSFVGSLDYFANVDALEWFLSEIWPLFRRRFPEGTLVIAGRARVRPRFLDGILGVRYLGFVPRIEDITDQSDISIVPLRIAGGMRLKILDSLSRGLPLVSTAVGAEGVPQEFEGNSVMCVADGALEFVDAIERLSRSSDLRHSMACTGRRMIEARYSWGSLVSDYLGWLRKEDVIGEG